MRLQQPLHDGQAGAVEGCVVDGQPAGEVGLGDGFGICGEDRLDDLYVLVPVWREIDD